ncbi:MAG: hypothetical protein ACKVQS_13750 [Fimbriimonadaceae bacterium]
MSKTRSNKGFTTAEMMVSGGVMLAVTFLTFDVMLTNAKISTAGVKAASAESTQRSGIELLQQDILISSAALTSAEKAGDYCSKNNKTLILSQPIYDNAGDVVEGKNKVIVYMIKDVSGVKSLIRLAGIQVGKNEFTLSKTDTIVDNIKKFNFRLAKSTSIMATGGVLAFPGTIVSGKPSLGKIRLIKMISLKPAISIQNDIEDSSKRGVSSCSLLSAKSKIALAALTATPANPISATDVLYEVDEEKTLNPDFTIDANNLKVWITVKGRKDQPDTTLTATGMMRNAN